MGLVTLAFVLGCVACIPFLLELLFQKEFVVHEKGAIVITGASSGIGLDAALALDSSGYTVFPGVRKDSDTQALKIMSSTLRPIIMDVADATSCMKAAGEVGEFLKSSNLPFVGLVNNAGISRRIPVELESIDAVSRMMDVNVVGIYRATIPFLEMIRKHKGRIVSTGSVAGLIATAGSATYSASKFAVEGITDSLRHEMAPFGVSVSIVEPAYVKTKIASKQVGENAPINHSPATEGAKELYNAFLSKQDEKRIKADNLASDTSVTSEAIVHALTSPTPKTRYIVANYFGLPAFVLGWVHWALNDRAEDALITFVSSK